MNDKHTRKKMWAFSLVEMLTVVALIGVLMGLMVPAMSGIGKSGRNARNIAELSGLLDQARAHAVAQSKYVWVALRSGERGGEQVVDAAVISSSESPSLNTVWSSGQIIVPGQTGDFQLLGRVSKLSQAELIEDPAELQQLFGDRLPGAFGLASGGVKFQVKVDGRDEMFDRVLLFTPRGAARVGPAAGGLITFGVRPSAADQAKTYGLSINVLTGQNSVLKL
jgi:type II secretory pathway pseudopilin PulG